MYIYKKKNGKIVSSLNLQYRSIILYKYSCYMDKCTVVEKSIKVYILLVFKTCLFDSSSNV